MATYLHGQGASLALGGQAASSWDGHITSIDHTETRRQAQVKVMGQAFANTVTGAYHTSYRIGIAVDDAVPIAEFEVGATGTLTFTYATGDTLALAASVVTGIEITASVDGAVTGVIVVQANGALTHAVT